jgi:hypothetical protein
MKPPLKRFLNTISRLSEQNSYNNNKTNARYYDAFLGFLLGLRTAFRDNHG